MNLTNKERQARYRARLRADGLPRNRGPRRRALYLRMDDDLADELTRFAAEIGSSRPEAVRVVLEHELERWKEEKK